MKLFANGCSWTSGGGLNLDDQSRDEERLSLVWPHHLGKLLEADKVTNLSMGCGSNQRIVRTTFDWLLQQPKEELEDTIAVIQLTEPSRFEINHEDIWYNCKVGCVTFGDGKIITSHEDRVKANDLYDLIKPRLISYSDIEGEYSLLSSILTIDNLFKKFQLKDWYFWSFSHDFYRSKFKEYYLNNFKIVDQEYKEPIWEYSRVGTKFYNREFDPHPDIEGHEQIAKALFYEMEKHK